MSSPTVNRVNVLARACRKGNVARQIAKAALPSRPRQERRSTDADSREIPPESRHRWRD